MKFLSKKVYRHITSKDLDIMVLEVLSRNEACTKLQVYWIDKHTGNIRCIPPDQGTATIEIQAKDYSNWSELLDISE